MTPSDKKPMTADELARQVIRKFSIDDHTYLSYSSKPFDVEKEIKQALITFAAQEVEKATEPLVEALKKIEKREPDIEQMGGKAWLEMRDYIKRVSREALASCPIAMRLLGAEDGATDSK